MSKDNSVTNVIAVAEVVDLIATATGIGREIILSDTRVAAAVKARALVIAALRLRGRLSFPEIADALNGLLGRQTQGHSGAVEADQRAGRKELKQALVAIREL